MSEASLPSSYLEQYLEPYRDLILKDDIIELAINPDGNVWIERQGAHAMERVDRTVEAAVWLASEEASFSTGFCFDQSGGRATA